MRRVLRSLVPLAALFGASGASAGIADTPLPRFADGSASRVITAITGVVKRTRLQTDFVCTSFAANPVHVGVEIFDQNGALQNDVGAGVGAVLNVAPGQTITLGTSATAAYLETAVIPLATGSQGSARVVATDDAVRCNVMLLDDAVTPPVALATMGPGIQPTQGALLPAPGLPTFSSGRPATHAALVPGVIKRGRMQSEFFCTSLAAEVIDVGVEIFGVDGALENQVGQGNGAVLDIGPGATVSFGTTGTASLLETTVIVTRGVAQGFARIVATSPLVTCNALVLDADVTPPVSMSTLTTAEGVPGDVNRDGVVSAGDLPALVRQIYR